MDLDRSLDAAAGVRAPARDHRWAALAVVLTGAFLPSLDFNIINVSVPSIESGLRASFAQVQLIIAGYGLAYAIALVTGGRLGDIHGRRRIFQIGMGAFGVASALCGFAPTPHVLIAARVLQGLAAALMYPQVLSIIQVTFSVRERSLAFGLFGVVIGMGSIAGQLLGGLLVHANLFGWSWRPVFLVNLPVCAAALWAGRALVPESRSPSAPQLDLGGVALVTLSLSLLLYPLIAGRESGWAPWTAWSMAASLPVLGAFLLYERRRSRAGGSPLLEFSLFRHRAFVVGLLVALFFFMGLASFLLTLTLYLQQSLGLSPLRTGLTFTPFATGFLVASLASTRLAPRMGSRVLQAGAAGMASGLVWLITLVHEHGSALHSPLVLAPLFLYGLGQGLVQPPLVNIVLAGVLPREAGSASGVLSTLQQVSYALGIAALGSFFHALAGANQTPHGLAYAFGTVLLVNLALLFVTFVLVFFLPRHASEALPIGGH